MRTRGAAFSRSDALMVCAHLSIPVSSSAIYPELARLLEALNANPEALVDGSK